MSKIDPTRRIYAAWPTKKRIGSSVYTADSGYTSRTEAERVADKLRSYGPARVIAIREIIYVVYAK